MTRSIIHDSLMLGLVLILLFFLDIPYLNLLVAFILILVYCSRKQGIKFELGFEKPTSWVKTIAIASGLGISIVLLSYFVFLPLIEGATGQPLDLGMFESLRGNTGLLVSSLLLGWIVGGFLEETIFRAFWITRFVNHLPHKIAVVSSAISSSIVFGYLHTYQGPSGQILTGLVGLILATIYILNRRNIWLNIFTHGFVNTFSMLLLYFDIISRS